MAHQDDLRELIRIHRRRLQVLREQQALRGLNTPPETIIEIEDTEAKIAELQAELKQVEEEASWQTPVAVSDEARGAGEPGRTIEFRIEHGNIISYDADVVALKFARIFYGADRFVADALALKGITKSQLRPDEGEYRFVATQSGIRARHALFVGVPDVSEFGYGEIREFAKTVLYILHSEAPDTRHLAMTIHGTGYGLDGTETFLAQFAGYLEAIELGALPESLDCISIVSINRNRVKQLRLVLEQNLAGADYASSLDSRWGYRLTVPKRLGHAGVVQARKARAIETAGVESETKPHVFVAMPSGTDMEDIFYYGIQAPVHKMDFLCERVDQEVFAGGLFGRIKQRIETAAIVIAELSGADPNVYLIVGYALGKGRPILLLLKDEKELHFDHPDVRKCLTYDSIRDLEKALAGELKQLKAQGII
jgi:hypothetical protein